MIPCSQKVMTVDEKGKKFLELIDEQNNLQWSMISKLTALVKSEWNSIAIKHDLELLIAQHSEITRKLNSMEENSLL